MQVTIQPKDMQQLVVFIFAGAFERYLNDSCDDLRDFGANGKFNKTGHLPILF
jgi:hypothetical protein